MGGDEDHEREGEWRRRWRARARAHVVKEKESGEEREEEEEEREEENGEEKENEKEKEKEPYSPDYEAGGAWRHPLAGHHQLAVPQPVDVQDGEPGDRAVEHSGAPAVRHLVQVQVQVRV